MELTVNSAIQFNWVDETGRILALRCGHVDVAHPNGWYAIYVNNSMVFITDQPPDPGLFEYMQLETVQQWGEQVFRILFEQWERLPGGIK